MEGFTNFAEMFGQSMGLQEPWRIERAEFDEEKREVHVYISARKTAKYACPKCGKACTRYDDEETERVWRHGDVVFFPCYVHCQRPRVKCDEHGIHVVDAPWARPGSRYTLLFESYAMLLMQSMPIENARKMMRVSHTSMTNILRYWVKQAVDHDDLSGVRAICVDETSFRRGQSYVTVVSDAAARRVIHVEEGRMTDQQREKTQALSKQFPKTGRAFRMIQSLDTMYSCKNYAEANEVFYKLWRWLRRSRLEPMKRVAVTLMEHREQILGYFFHRLTNALAEGLNSMIQSAKRRARGFATVESYICMIYLTVGKLKLDCPPLFA
jgi:transposase